MIDETQWKSKRIEFGTSRAPQNHGVTSPSSSSDQGGTTEGTEYVRMLYLTCQIGMGPGLLRTSRGREEDDDGSADAT